MLRSSLNNSQAMYPTVIVVLVEMQRSFCDNMEESLSIGCLPDIHSHSREHETIRPDQGTVNENESGTNS
jgi:hypothetical protein